MSHAVPVQTASAEYDVLIGRGVLESLGEQVAAAASGRAAVIADESVVPLFGEVALGSIQAEGVEASLIVVPSGESSKSWERAGWVLERMAEEGFDRAACVVALGGGVVGDLAGFCAATFMRGVALVHAPTTLLAQVDSSIGGKTAVDLRAGKNLAGAFIQPKAVVSDTVTLESLPEIEWKSGLAEVAKSAVLDGEEFLGWLEGHAEALLRREPDVVLEAVRRCVEFKAGVVGRDELEIGLREVLNLGHTLGHAIERVAGYGTVPHGLAVGEGMRFAALLAERAAEAPASFALRQAMLLDRLGLPRSAQVYDSIEIRNAMSADKKARNGRPRFVLAVAPGETIVRQIPEDLLVETLEEWTEARRESDT